MTSKYRDFDSPNSGIDTGSRPTDLDRYVRQMRFGPFGEKGQQELGTKKVLVIGCGALGTHLADTMLRAGVGTVRIVDRDFLELNNLQRQVLFNETDVENGLPKAIVAADKLRKINSQVTVEEHVADVNYRNIRSLCNGIDLILDGTDNFEIRFLINDAAVALGIPWVYGGCLGADGQTMTIVPGETACLRCLMIDGPPPPGTTPTCDSAGILAPIISVISAYQANEALKILSGNLERISRHLTVFEMWENRIRQLDVSRLREQVDCPTCHKNEFRWLDGTEGSQSAVLCGRNAVQLSFSDRDPISLDELKKKLVMVGEVTGNRFLLRLSVEKYLLTVFKDGRAIVQGTEDIAEARSVYAKYVGN